jgi:ligand-binding sensor protein
MHYLPATIYRILACYAKISKLLKQKKKKKKKKRKRKKKEEEDNSRVLKQTQYKCHTILLLIVYS